MAAAAPSYQQAALAAAMPSPPPPQLTEKELKERALQEKLDKRGAIMSVVMKKFITNFMNGRQAMLDAQRAAEEAKRARAGKKGRKKKKKPEEDKAKGDKGKDGKKKVIKTPVQEAWAVFMGDIDEKINKAKRCTLEDIYRGVAKLEASEQRLLACIVSTSNNKKVLPMEGLNANLMNIRTTIFAAVASFDYKVDRAVLSATPGLKLMVERGASADQMVSHGFDAGEMLRAGFTRAEVIAASCHDLGQLHSAGITVQELRDATTSGYPNPCPPLPTSMPPRPATAPGPSAQPQPAGGAAGGSALAGASMGAGPGLGQSWIAKGAAGAGAGGTLSGMGPLASTSGRVAWAEQFQAQPAVALPARSIEGHRGASALRQAGYSAVNLVDGGVKNAYDLKQAGFSRTELLESGVPGEDLAAVGITPEGGTQTVKFLATTMAKAMQQDTRTLRPWLEGTSSPAWSRLLADGTSTGTAAGASGRPSLLRPMTATGVMHTTSTLISPVRAGAAGGGVRSSLAAVAEGGPPPLVTTSMFGASSNRRPRSAALGAGTTASPTAARSPNGGGPMFGSPAARMGGA